MRAYMLVGLLVAASAMAGCTGQFDIQQTEPIRIQLDGAPEERRVVASGSGDGDDVEKSEFRIERTEEVEDVTVVVQVTKVEADDGAPTTTTATQPPATTGNQTTQPTGNQTASPSAQRTIILVIVEDRDTGEKLAEERVDASTQSQTVNLDVNVKGKDNVVVVTQAIEGSADVSVEANRAEGGGASPSPTSPTTGNTTSPTTTPA